MFSLPNVLYSLPNVMFSLPNVMFSQPDDMFSLPNVMFSLPNIMVSSPNVMFSLTNVNLSLPDVNLGLLHYESSMTISHPVEAVELPLYVFAGRTTGKDMQQTLNNATDIQLVEYPISPAAAALRHENLKHSSSCSIF